LEKTRWCRKDAAKMLGISYKALLYKMRQFNLDTPRSRRSAATVAVDPAPIAAGRNDWRRHRQGLLSRHTVGKEACATNAARYCWRDSWYGLHVTTSGFGIERFIGNEPHVSPLS